MPRPISHTISGLSASDFDDIIRASDPNFGTYSLFFADGDNWFNKFYPLRGNLLEQLDLPRGCNMLDRSWSGDKASDMFSPNRIDAAAQYIDAYPYRAILLNAGGNVGALLSDTGNNASLSNTAIEAAFDDVGGLIGNFCNARQQSS